jgi:hypothetical protein
MVNIHAQALGRLGIGRKKTMSKAAILQRKQAALKRKTKAIPTMQKKYSQDENSSRHESVSA